MSGRDRLVRLQAPILREWEQALWRQVREIERLLAYSSIAQAGYLLVGVRPVGRSPLALPALVVVAAACAAMHQGEGAQVARVGRELEQRHALQHTDDDQWRRMPIEPTSVTA